MSCDGNKYSVFHSDLSEDKKIMLKRSIYLKINRDEDFAIRNLSHWIDVAYLIGLDCYIVCDKQELIERIRKELFLSNECIFIKSDRGTLNQKIAKKISNRNWENAAYSHITTFIHAYNNKYDYFWNIDADDTMICLRVDRIVELLKNVEKYAEEKGIDCFSMDMWRSKWKGEHWSFGITYTNGKIDWYKEMLIHCDDEAYRYLESGMNYNIDCYFTYLKSWGKIQIETFYFENLKFIHYSTDFFNRPVSSAFYHWTGGKLLFPMMLNCIGVKELSSFDIYADIIKLDIHIRDEEARDILSYYSKDGKEFSGYVNWKNIVNQKLFSIKNRLFMRNYDASCEIVCFGAGNCMENNIEKILSIYDLKYVCDNDPKKWGKDLGKGVICISPEELSKKDNILVIILIYSRPVAHNIAYQLENMGIKNYDFVENWLKCVE